MTFNFATSAPTFADRLLASWCSLAARQRGEKDQFVLVSGRRAAGAPRFRSLVQTRKGKRQREATELDAAKVGSPSFLSFGSGRSAKGLSP